MCNSENKERVRFILDGNVDEYEDDVVTVPRDEYNELVAESTLLEVVKRMIYTYANGYELRDVLQVVLDIHDSEEEPSNE